MRVFLSFFIKTVLLLVERGYNLDTSLGSHFYTAIWLRCSSESVNISGSQIHL